MTDKELPPTALQNALEGIDNQRQRLQDKANATFHDIVGGNDKWTGQFTFDLIDAETGELDRRETYNQTVDEGENAVLQYIGGITDSDTQTFTGDGAATSFQLSFPARPVRDVVSVTIDGADQTEHTDFSLDYWSGDIHFDSAPANGSNISVEVDYVTYPWEYLAVGTDNTAVDDGDTSLYAEATRIGLDDGYYTRNESAVEVTGRWTFQEGEANVTIAEAGLFNVSATAPVTGDMLNRTVVSPAIEKSQSQKLRVTWALSM